MCALAPNSSDENDENDEFHIVDVSFCFYHFIFVRTFEKTSFSSFSSLLVIKRRASRIVRDPKGRIERQFLSLSAHCYRLNLMPAIPALPLIILSFFNLSGYLAVNLRTKDTVLST